MFCTVLGMSTRPKPAGPPAKDSLSVELGGWFKANATGGGVIVIGVILVALGALGLAQFWLTVGG
jgi:hypothetical protein